MKARKAKVLVAPTSTISVPVGTTASTVTIASILKAIGIADSNGVLLSSIEAFRIVGGEFRQAINPQNSSSAVVTSVKFAGGQTYQLVDPYHSVKIRVSDRNPLGFWKTDTTGNAFATEGVVDCVSFTVAVRYRQINFQ